MKTKLDRWRHDERHACAPLFLKSYAATRQFRLGLTANLIIGSRFDYSSKLCHYASLCITIINNFACQIQPAYPELTVSVFLGILA